MNSYAIPSSNSIVDAKFLANAPSYYSQGYTPVTNTASEFYPGNSAQESNLAVDPYSPSATASSGYGSLPSASSSCAFGGSRNPSVYGSNSDSCALLTSHIRTTSGVSETAGSTRETLDDGQHTAVCPPDAGHSDTGNAEEPSTSGEASGGVQNGDTKPMIFPWMKRNHNSNPGNSHNPHTYLY